MRTEALEERPRWRREDPAALARYVVPAEAERWFPASRLMHWGLATTAGRGEAAKVIYDFLAQQPEKLLYAVEPEPLDVLGGQAIRSATRIHEERKGSCLDFTVLYAGLAISVGLCPVIAITADHALMLVALARGPGEKPLASDPFRSGSRLTVPEAIAELVKANDFLAIDCTGFAEIGGPDGRPPLPFDEAVTAASALLSAVRSAIDVSGLHALGETPLAWDDRARSLAEVRAAAAASARAICSAVAVTELQPPLARPPLMNHLLSLVERDSWRIEMASLVGDLGEAARLMESARPISEACARVPKAGTCFSLLNELQKLFLPRLRDIVAAERRRLASLPTTSSSRFLHDRLDALERPLVRLLSELASPHFGLVLAVIGGLGEGKTHTFAHLPEALSTWQLGVDPSEAMLLCFREYPRSMGTFEQWILGEIRQQTGYVTGSLKDFFAFAQAGGPRSRVLLAFDDFEVLLKATSAKEVMRALQTSSGFDVVRWCFWLSHASYPSAGGVDLEERWRMLSIRSDERLGQRPDHDADVAPQAGGWFMLDDINRATSTGLEVIEAWNNRNPESELNTTGLEESPAAQSHLASPQVAWVAIEARADINKSGLLNLNHIQVAGGLEQVRLRRVADESLGEIELRQFVSALATAITTGLADRAPLFAALEKVSAFSAGKSALAELGRAREAWSRLERGSLVGRDRTPDLALHEVETVRLLTPFFWSYQVGRVTERLFANDPVAALSPWLPQVKDDEVRSGALEFYLLLLDARGAVDELATVWSLASRSYGLPRVAAWIAAAKGSSSLKALALANAKQAELTEPDLLFALLYFMGSLEICDADLASRIAILAPFYERAAREGFGEYLLFVIRRSIWQAKELEDLAAACHLLSGIELLGATSEVADLVAERVVELANDDWKSIIKWLIDFCHAEAQEPRWRQVQARLAEIEDGEDPQLGDRLKPEEGRRYIREWIICWIFRKCSPDDDERSISQLFWKLEGDRWYVAVRDTLIRREMEREANIWLGTLLREHPALLRDFLALLDDLLESSLSRIRRLAFFLIRHTERTAGSKGVLYRREFAPYLAKIYLDDAPEVLSLGGEKSFYRDFWANLGGDSRDPEDKERWRKLEAARRKPRRGRERGSPGGGGPPHDGRRARHRRRSKGRRRR